MEYNTKNKNSEKNWISFKSSALRGLLQFNTGRQNVNFLFYFIFHHTNSLLFRRESTLVKCQKRCQFLCFFFVSLLCFWFLFGYQHSFISYTIIIIIIAVSCLRLIPQKLVSMTGVRVSSIQNNAAQRVELNVEPVVD